MNKIITTFVCLLAVGICFAQTPGGVTTNPFFWYRGDGTITNPGTSTMQVNDMSLAGNNEHLTPTGGTGNAAPSLTSGNGNAQGNNINYNTALAFSTSTQYLSFQPPVVGTRSATSDANGVSATGGGTNNTASTNGGGTYTVYRFNNTGVGAGTVFAVSQSFGLSRFAGMNTGNKNMQSFRSTLVFPTTPTLHAVTLRDGNGTQTTNGGTVAIDGTATVVNPLAFINLTLSTGWVFVGGDGSGTNYGGGLDIAEIIQFPTDMTADRTKIESYLGIKWGVNLDDASHTYTWLNSAGNTIYQNDATFFHNVIGIERDDNGGLAQGSATFPAQKQSHTTGNSLWSSDSLRLFASTNGNAGTNADLAATNALNSVVLSTDRSSIVIGDDGLDQNSSAAVGMPAGIIARLNKTWKLTNTGFAQPFTIEIVLPAGVPLANIGDLRLICNTAAGTSTPSALGTGSTVIAGGANGITFGQGSIIMSVDPTAGSSPFAAGNTAIFTIGSIADGTLPLNLLGFEAKVNGAKVATQWTVSNEQDVKGYEVQRSANSINGWITVATQNAAGNSTGSRTYSAADNNPLSGTSYYRLKINDHNGRIIYSDIRKVQFSATAIVRITPNPTSGSITIKAPAGELRSITIIDATGKPVQQIRGNAGDTQLSVDLSNLTKGVYIIKTQTTSQKVMVK